MRQLCLAMLAASLLAGCGGSSEVVFHSGPIGEGPGTDATVEALDALNASFVKQVYLQDRALAEDVSCWVRGFTDSTRSVAVVFFLPEGNIRGTATPALLGIPFREFGIAPDGSVVSTYQQSASAESGERLEVDDSIKRASASGGECSFDDESQTFFDRGVPASYPEALARDLRDRFERAASIVTDEGVAIEFVDRLNEAGADTAHCMMATAARSDRIRLIVFSSGEERPTVNLRAMVDLQGGTVDVSPSAANGDGENHLVSCTIEDGQLKLIGWAASSDSTPQISSTRTQALPAPGSAGTTASRGRETNAVSDLLGLRTYSEAIGAIGPASSCVVTSDYEADASWDERGVFVRLASLGGYGQVLCNQPENAPISHIRVVGRDWQTSEGLRVGATTATLEQLYPNAHSRRGGGHEPRLSSYWLAAKEEECHLGCGPDEYGEIVTVPTLIAHVSLGRVVSFYIPVGAQGE